MLHVEVHYRLKDDNQAAVITFSTLNDLKQDANNVERGEFIYKISEVAPDGASTATIDGKQWKVSGNIRYTTDVNYVKIVAVNDGSGEVITTTQYSTDGEKWRDVGDFVPVYTNYALVPTPLEGTKTWVGGENSEHVNGAVTIDGGAITAASDRLGLQLQRKVGNGTPSTITKDDAGRDLAIVWAKKITMANLETGETTTSYESQVGGDGSGPYTYTVMVIADGTYVDPILNTADASGNTYTYSIAEPTPPPAGYVATTSGMAVTNTNGKTDDLYATKVWDDANDAEGLRPDTVTVHLFKEVPGEGGSAEVKQVEVAEAELTKSSGDTYSSAHWTDLPVYDSKGNKIKYIVVEETVAGYTTKYQVDAQSPTGWKPEADAAVKVELNGSATAQRVYVQNSLVPETNQVKVTKVWDDQSNKEGKRPASATFELYEYVWDENTKAYTGPTKVEKRSATQADVDAAKAANPDSDMKVGDEVVVSDMVLTGTATNPESLVWNETTPTNAFTWNGEWVNLPATKEGKTVIYTVKEVLTGSEYAVPGTPGTYSNAPTITGDQLAGYTATNTYTSAYQDIEIRKVWVDKLYNDDATSELIGAERPASIKVTITGNNTGDEGGPTTQTATINASTPEATATTAGFTEGSYDAAEFTYKFVGLPILAADGTTITYTVTEEALPNYKTTYINGPGATNKVIVNTYEVAEFTGTKAWQNSSVAHNNASEVKLTVHYQKYNGSTAVGEPGTISNPKIVWGTTDDTKNQFKVVGLPVADSAGNTYSYWVSETAMAGYETTYSGQIHETGDAVDGITSGGTITNRQLEGLTTATITKSWVDSSARFMRPNTLTLELWRTYTGANDQPVYERVTKDADDHTIKTTMSYDDAVDGNEDRWALAVTNLPSNIVVTLAGGAQETRDYTYYWKETVPTYYETPTVFPSNDPAPGDTTRPEGASESAQWVKVANGTTLLNSLSTFEFRAAKAWADGNNRDDTRPLLPMVYLYSTTDDPESDSVEWKPVGNVSVSRNDDRDGLVPLKAWYSGDGSSRGELIDQNGKLILPIAEDGEVITYRLVERNANGYTTTYQVDGGEKKEAAEGITFSFHDKELLSSGISVTVTNTFNPNFSVTKVWNDADDPSKRPGVEDYKKSLHLWATTYELNTDTFEYDATTTDVTATYADKLDVVENEDGTYTATWVGLPQYGEDGPVFDGSNRTIYHAVEDQVAGYQMPAYHNKDDAATSDDESEATDRAYDHGTITNALVEPDPIPTFDVPVSKVFDDADNQDGLRPGSVTVSLLANGAPAVDINGVAVAPRVLSADNNWKDTFYDLPGLDAQGGVITYTVVEDAVAGYTTTYAPTDGLNYQGDLAAGFTVTNTHKAGTTQVTATKVWASDDDNAYGLRTDVALHLYGTSGGQVVYDAGTQSIALGDEPASTTWTNLPTHHYNAEPLEWLIVEEPVFGYTASYEWDEAGTTCTVTNTFSEPTAQVTATKQWDDGDNRDGMRPDSVTFQLVKKVGSGDPVAVEGSERVVGADQQWMATWTDLPISEQGEATGEASSETSSEASSEASSAGEAGNASQSSDAGQAGSTELPVLYSVQEVGLDASLGYSTVVEATEPGQFTVHNMRTPDTTSVVVRKIWNDNDNADGLRPDHVNITLKGDGEVVATGTLTVEGDWQATYEGLPRNNASGQPVAYTVEEGALDGYTPAYSGTGTAEDPLVVTNTHSSATPLVLRATKAWAGEDGDTSARKNVVLHLMKVVEGYGPVEVEGQSKTIAADATGDALTVEWTGLPSVEDGRSVTYTVQEDAIEGYTTAYSDGAVEGGIISVTVTNTKAPTPSPQPTPDPVVLDQPRVIYMDPKAAEGSMALAASKYASAQDAAAAAAALTGAPADPAHEGFTFVGWVANQDELGDWILMAKYNEVEPGKKRVTVSYVDPQSGKVVVSEITDDPSSVFRPEPASYPNMSFVGWEDLVDASGNHIFVAKYKADCQNNPTPTPDPEPQPEPQPDNTPAPAKATVPAGVSAAGTPVKGTPATSDAAPVSALVAIAAASAAAAIFSRRRLHPATTARHAR